ncbi:MAG TPA: hypothetical protein VMP01_21590 [Pirellulaceae bacterium]|nr:hypothetical protein [Pirellulaceae bacterium]
MPSPASPTAADPAEAEATAAWMRRRGIPAWLLSLLLHLSVFTVLGLVVQVTPGVLPNAGDTLRGGEIVLASNATGKTGYFSDADGGDSSPAAATNADATAEAAASPVSAVSELPPTGGPQLPAANANDAGSGLPGGLAPGAGELLGSSKGGPRGTGVGQKAQTEVFGVQGEGSSFLYVFDRSSSMGGFEGRPLASAKRELIASLEKLDQVRQFQIIFYNQEPRLMQLGGQQGRMVFANDDGKRQAADFVGRITASGGTRHMEALTMALNLRPDAIFFLTDAEEPQLSPGELAKIRRLNHGTSINTIEFGAGTPSGAVNFLKRLARENGGNYGYVDVTRLPRM